VSKEERDEKRAEKNRNSEKVVRMVESERRGGSRE